MTRATAQVLAALGLDDPAEVRDRLLVPWREAVPELLPTHLQRGEPVRTPFDHLRLDVPVGGWAGRRRDSTGLVVGFGPGLGRLHASVDLSINRAFSSDLAVLTDVLVRTLAAEFAMAHELTEPDRLEAIASDRQDLRYLNLRTGAAQSLWGYDVQLPHGLPTLFWRTYFGPTYVDLIGVDRLVTAPVARVETIGDAIGLVLTEEPPSQVPWPIYRDVRDRAIDHLGLDLFWPNASRVPSLPPPR